MIPSGVQPDRSPPLFSRVAGSAFSRVAGSAEGAGLLIMTLHIMTGVGAVEHVPPRTAALLLLPGYHARRLVRRLATVCTGRMAKQP